MASQWYQKTPTAERGPLTFAELAQLVRVGTLGEDDLVRRDGQGEWQRVANVVGLLRAARKGGSSETQGREQPHKSSPPALDKPLSPVRVVRQESSRGDPEQGQAAAESGMWGGKVGLRTVLATILGLAVITAAVVGGWHWHEEATRFPLPTGLRPPPPAGRFFFGWGPLSLFEYLLVWADTAVVTGFVIYTLIRWVLRTGTRGRNDSRAARR